MPYLVSLTRISEPFFLSSCTQSCTQTSPPIFRLRPPSEKEGRSPAKEESSSPGSHRIGFYSGRRNACLSCLFELADVGGLLQIIMVKRGSHSFPVRLPDSQLAGVFVPTRDHLPHLTDNRPRALRG